MISLPPKEMDSLCLDEPNKTLVIMPKEIQKISGTKIRAKMRKTGKLKN